MNTMTRLTLAATAALVHDTKTTPSIKHHTFNRSVAVTDCCQVAPPCLLSLLLFPDFPRGRTSLDACAGRPSFFNSGLNTGGRWIGVTVCIKFMEHGTLPLKLTAA